MPIYEYRCKRCGAQFELIQKLRDAPIRKCRDCRGPLEKLVSRSSFQLKGTGWYVTDYARKSSDSSGKEVKPSKESKESKEGESAVKNSPASAAKESRGTVKSNKD